VIPTQNTDSWREFRKSRIGASDSPIILGLSPWTSPYELWEEKLGLRAEKDLSHAMTRGIDLEEEARNCYQQMTGEFVFPIVKIYPIEEFLIASLDGINLEGTRIVEIKVPGKKTVDMAIKGEIPIHYQCQMQHQMLVTGLETCDYFCYDGTKGYLIQLQRDDGFIDHMIAEEIHFYECLTKKEWKK